MEFQLNDRALTLVEQAENCAAELRIEPSTVHSGGRILDFGINTPSSLTAGLALAEICLADLGEVTLYDHDLCNFAWPHVAVTSDHPLAACLFSQYAGMQISLDNYFAMGSGPLRAIANREELYQKLNYSETAEFCVGVLETNKLPTDEVFAFISNQTGIPVENTVLLAAPTSSLAGNLQVVARSIETALHKLFELGFAMSRVVSGTGSAPLPPVAADDLTGIGRTNDAILYGVRVTLWVTGDDASLAEIGPCVPSSI